MNTLKIEIPEFLFVIYFWNFALLRPLLQHYSNYSSIILFISATILITIQIIYDKTKKTNHINKPILICILLLIIFCCDAILRGSQNSFKYIYEYIYRGIIPIVFLSKIKYSQKILLYYTYISTLTFCIYVVDPINNYSIFGDYMTFGFNLAFPAFCGIFLGFHYFKIKWMLLLEIVCFLEIVIFANRGALLSSLVFIILYCFFCVNYKSKKNKIFLIFSIIIITYIYLNINTLFRHANELMQNTGFQSYSISKITGFIEGSGVDDQFSGRLEIWDKAHKMINENPIIGSGIEAFSKKYDSYSHNIYLDVLLFYGYSGLIFVTFICIFSFLKIIKSKGTIQILGILIFCLWCPKLFLSTYFFQETSFWGFLIFPLLIFRLKIFELFTKKSNSKNGKPLNLITNENFNRKLQ